MKYTLHPHAERELTEVVRYYRKEAGRGVAVRFLDEFERVARLLAANPELGTLTSGERRWFPLHGFPYSIIYRSVPGGLRILVVRHQHRDPGYGGARV